MPFIIGVVFVMRAFATMSTQRAGLSVVALALALAGCALPAVPGRMTVRLSEQTLIRDRSELRQAIQVGTVSGGREDEPVLRSAIRNADFADALRQSLAAHAMLAPGQPVFRLDAALLELRQPIGGLSLKVTSRIRYRLTRVATGQLVFEREIEAPFTQPFSPFIAAAERFRFATEGSLRENMRLFLLALAWQDQQGWR